MLHSGGTNRGKDMAFESGNQRPPSLQHEGLVTRAKNILIQPKAEWELIDAEPASVGGIYRNWVVILAAIPPLATLIGSLVFGISLLGVTYRPGVVEALGAAITSYVLTLIGVYVLALIIDALAPQFGGTPNRVQAVKVAAYSSTAAWVGGIFGLMPSLALLGVLFGLYSLYLLYLGLPRLMKAPADKAVAYTVVTILAAIVVAILIGIVTAPIARVFGGGPAVTAPNVYANP
jgi:Yip1 domain